MFRLVLFISLNLSSAFAQNWPPIPFNDLKTITFPKLNLSVGGLTFKICHALNGDELVVDPKLILGLLAIDTQSQGLVVDEKRNANLTKKLCWYKIEGTQKVFLLEMIWGENSVVLEKLFCEKDEDILQKNIDLALVVLDKYWIEGKKTRFQFCDQSVYEIAFKWRNVDQLRQTCHDILLRLQGYYPAKATNAALIKHALLSKVLTISKCPGTKNMYFLDESTDTLIFELVAAEQAKIEQRQNSSSSQSPPILKPMAPAVEKEPLLKKPKKAKKGKRLSFGCFIKCW